MHRRCQPVEVLIRAFRRNQRAKLLQVAREFGVVQVRNQVGGRGVARVGRFAREQAVRFVARPGRVAVNFRFERGAAL